MLLIENEGSCFCKAEGENVDAFFQGFLRFDQVYRKQYPDYSVIHTENFPWSYSKRAVLWRKFATISYDLTLIWITESIFTQICVVLTCYEVIVTTGPWKRFLFLTHWFEGLLFLAISVWQHLFQEIFSWEKPLLWVCMPGTSKFKCNCACVWSRYPLEFYRTVQVTFVVLEPMNLQSHLWGNFLQLIQSLQLSFYWSTTYLSLLGSQKFAEHFCSTHDKK